jgi:hypothetical protein
MLHAMPRGLFTWGFTVRQDEKVVPYQLIECTFGGRTLSVPARNRPSMNSTTRCSWSGQSGGCAGGQASELPPRHG